MRTSSFLFALFVSLLVPGAVSARERWTAEEAGAWYARLPWLVGCNFGPSSAINQLEMWQADTWDPRTIDRELGWAASLGFNSVRVFLHDLLWKEDREGFLRRVEDFLKTADKHGIGTLFVLLDGVWDPYPKPGKQRDPRPHVHNSGWVQSPGAEVLKDPARHDELKGFVHGIVHHFRGDRRVHGWDVFNEPDNDNRNSYGANGTKTEIPNKAAMATLLLKKVFTWAREADPSQPLTAGVWVGPWPDPARLAPHEKLMIEEADVISFHSYGRLEDLKLRVEQLRRHGRPLLCTEYMARPQGSRFDPHLGYMKEQKVAAYNWGFVDGKTQTIYPWDTWQKQYTAPPPLWFHDIFHRDGKAYDAGEVEYIRGLTKKGEGK